MRLDLALVERGLARSRTQAARLIAAGRVSVDGVAATRASQQVLAHHEVAAETERWVSRAAGKLLAALEDSGTVVPHRVLDAGASTGGFTQVCLARGARRVYAFDVGHDQLAPELSDDPRVVRRDGLNLRDLGLQDVEGEPVDLVVADVSFISLQLLLEPLTSVLGADGVALLLVKPQFEVGREALGAGGVVRDPAARAEAVERVVRAGLALGWRETWRGISAIPGLDGNVEYFVRLGR